MLNNEFEQLILAFKNEVSLWKPSEQNFETSLTKAKMHSGIDNIKLSQSQKSYLKEIFLQAKNEEDTKQ